MRRPLAELEEELDAMPEEHVRAFLGIPQGGSDSCVDLSCGCPNRVRNAEELDPASNITLRIHDAKRYRRRVTLRGNWIANLEESGIDEFGPYYILKARPSRFKEGSAVDVDEVPKTSFDREDRRRSFDDGRGAR